MTSDFLVIGSGIAGISFAIRAAEHGSVTLITKNDPLNSNTAWAQGGISAVLPNGLRDQNDSIEKHIADTLDAGAGLCDEETVRTIVGEGAQTIEELVSWGTTFDRKNDRYSLGREGGHSERRILHSKDTTGHEIASSLLDTAHHTPSLKILTDHIAIDLITTGKLGNITDNRVIGAYVLDKSTGEVHTLRSDRTILATGGCGKVYLYTTNPDSATGDGVAMPGEQAQPLPTWNSSNSTLPASTIPLQRDLKPVHFSSLRHCVAKAQSCSTKRARNLP
jgi:L-aspartate oxidase